ncbi:hypothetical protein Pfo_000106 [Paulownia fortunei]|nr:hypothetical protein Pfo_000106 [Paulownia fortunei]
MWRTTWYSLSKLAFDYCQFPEMKTKLDAFVNFIDQTLAHHDESDVKILELRLWSLIDFGIPIKTEWIAFSIQHNVEKLVLYGKIDEVKKLSDCVFSCQSLVKLELAVQELVLTLPETIALPNLRKLKFKFLVLSELVLNQDLFSRLPALEKLSIFFCNVGELFKKNNLSLSHWLIEYLSMVYYLPRQVAFDLFHDLVMLDINLWPVMEHVRILMLLISRCPNLITLFLGGFRSLIFIAIENFGGEETELMLVKSLLANTTYLVLMRIVMSIFMSNNDMDLKTSEILGYEKASRFADQFANSISPPCPCDCLGLVISVSKNIKLTINYHKLFLQLIFIGNALKLIHYIL